MGGEDREVDVEFTEPERHVRAGLACVEQDERANRTRRGGDSRHRRDRAGHIGDVGEGDESRIRGNDRQRLQVDAPIGSQIEPRELGAGSRAQLLPWHDIRVVLRPRTHDAVALPHPQCGGVGAADALGGIAHADCDKVDCLGSVLRPHDLIGRAPNERGKGSSGALEGVDGLVTQQVSAPMNGPVAEAVEVGLGVNDARRFLRGRRRVEVGDRCAAAPDAFQNREVRTNRVELGGGEVGRHGDQRPRYLS